MAAALALVVVSVAAVRQDPGPSVPTTAPDGPAGAAPTTTTPDAAVPEPPTTTAPIPTAGSDADAPPVADGGELPEQPGGAEHSPAAVPLSPPPAGQGTEVDTEAIAAEQRRVADLLAGAVDPLLAARRIEADAIASLTEVDRILRTVREEHARAVSARDTAAERALRAGEELDEARERVRAADEELRDMAVAMYLETPKQRAMLLSVDHIEDRHSVSALMAASTEQVTEATLTASTAAAGAEAAEQRAAAAAVDAAATEAEVASLVASVEAELQRRTAEVERVQLTIAALSSQVAGFAVSTSLAELMSIEEVTNSGVVVVDVASDGSWSVLPIGFPSGGDIVRITGTTITVHRLIADEVRALIDAASADGVALNGWGHRDARRQVELRRAHCGGSYAAVFEMASSSCRPPTARPGRSMHERGLAIDFAHCSSRSSACYRWLAEHAAAYGLYNLPSEPWHWSTNGH